MKNDTVDGFYSKLDGYAESYWLDHGPRLRALLEKYNLVEKLKHKSVVDVGGGLGFLGKLLDPSTRYIVFDGANTLREQTRLCKGEWIIVDLDKDGFGNYGTDAEAVFCLETLEHLTNPYHAIVEIKKLVKLNGDIFLSVPTETVWHNTPYPSLFWPPANFVQWLGQMALPIVDAYIYTPKDRGWPAYQYWCRNAPWEEARMLFPKSESKFFGKKPHEYANL